MLVGRLAKQISAFICL